MKLIESVSFNNTGLTKHLGYDKTDDGKGVIHSKRMRKALIERVMK
jgi:hypothetical protein